MGYISMRGAMKTVTPQTMSPIELVRNGVKEGVFRERLMKSRIEYGNLRNTLAKQMPALL